MSDKPKLEVLEGGAEIAEKTPLESEPHITSVEDIIEELNEEQNEQIMQFYQDNQQLVDMLGGLEIFETLFEMTDEEFELVAPSIYQLFNETLSERETRSEISAMFSTGQWQIEEVEREINIAYMLIEEIEELGQPKKDFLKRIMSSIANTIRKVYNLKAIDIPCEVKEGVELPTYAHETDAGMDIYAPEEYTIAPGETIIIPTGIKCAIPEGYAILIQPRSGQSVKTKLRIANTPGLIDSGYRDEIGVIVENIEPPFKDIDYEFDENGKIQINSILHGQSYTIAAGQKFAQMRLVQVPTVNFVKVNSVGEIGENRNGGFGSTGM